MSQRKTTMKKETNKLNNQPVKVDGTLEGVTLGLIASFAKSLVLFRSIGDRSRKKFTESKDNDSRSTK